jgi:hypothetical protein
MKRFIGNIASTAFITTVVSWGSATTVGAQEYPRAEDVASPEAIVLAAYASIARAPGENYDWDRFRSLHLPEATLISNPEQRAGSFDVLSVEGFIDWIDRATEPIIGTSQDLGFSEDEIHNVVNRYGDIANVFSTYEKHFYGETQNLGRGINTFNVVFHEGRWWIVSIVWDEESGAGPIPEKYLP